MSEARRLALSTILKRKRVSCEGRRRKVAVDGPLSDSVDSAARQPWLLGANKSASSSQRILEDVLAELSRIEDGVESSLASSRLAVLLGSGGRCRSVSMAESFTRSARHCIDGVRTSEPS